MDEIPDIGSILDSLILPFTNCEFDKYKQCIELASTKKYLRIVQALQSKID